MQNYSNFLLLSPFHHFSLSPSAGSFLTDICSREWWTELWSNYHGLHFPNQLAACVLKNTSTKSQQGVKGSRVSHLKANDVLPCEQALWILICWILSHLCSFQPLLDETRLVPMKWYCIITMLVLKALCFTPSTSGCSARRKALRCQLGFRFCSRKAWFWKCSFAFLVAEHSRGWGAVGLLGVPAARGILCATASGWGLISQSEWEPSYFRNLFT